MKYQSTKIIELGSCAFRQWKADSHCKFIHGYRLVAKFWFGAETLDERNWVVDFGGLKELKKVLEHQFDHTLCVSADDPQLTLFKQLHDAGVCDLRVMNKGVGIERTAEWCFDVADSHIRGITKNRCCVERVEVWEHEKNSAIVYVADQNPIEVIENFDLAKQAPSIKQLETNTPVTEHHTGPKPAVVGNKVTTGLSNPFGGTSWGL